MTSSRIRHFVAPTRRTLDSIAHDKFSKSTTYHTLHSVTHTCRRPLFECRTVSVACFLRRPLFPRGFQGGFRRPLFECRTVSVACFLRRPLFPRGFQGGFRRPLFECRTVSVACFLRRPLFPRGFQGGFRRPLFEC